MSKVFNIIKLLKVIFQINLIYRGVLNIQCGLLLKRKPIKLFDNNIFIFANCLLLRVSCLPLSDKDYMFVKKK